MTQDDPRQDPLVTEAERAELALAMAMQEATRAKAVAVFAEAWDTEYDERDELHRTMLRDLVEQIEEIETELWRAALDSLKTSAALDTSTEGAKK